MFLELQLYDTLLVWKRIMEQELKDWRGPSAHVACARFTNITFLDFPSYIQAVISAAILDFLVVFFSATQLSTTVVL